jgi:uncharacterized repeat protein (TIGR01451 family)
MKGSTKGYIIAGLFTLAAALGGSYLTHMFDSQKEPDLVITAFGNLTTGHVGQTVTFEMDLFNQGTATAKDCMVIINDGIPGPQGVHSQFFDVTPTPASIPVKVPSQVYLETGTYVVKSQLFCDNFKSQSVWFSLQIFP